MLDHVAIPKTSLSQLTVELVTWYITKSCLGVVHNMELGEREWVEGETKFLLSMFNNFIIVQDCSCRQDICRIVEKYSDSGYYSDI